MVRSSKNKNNNNKQRIESRKYPGLCVQTTVAHWQAWELGRVKTSKYFTLTLNMTSSVYMCVIPIDCSQQGALFQLRQDKQRVLHFMAAVEIKRPLMIRQC